MGWKDWFHTRDKYWRDFKDKHTLRHSPSNDRTEDLTRLTKREVASRNPKPHYERFRENTSWHSRASMTLKGRNNPAQGASPKDSVKTPHRFGGTRAQYRDEYAGQAFIRANACHPLQHTRPRIALFGTTKWVKLLMYGATSGTFLSKWEAEIHSIQEAIVKRMLIASVAVVPLRSPFTPYCLTISPALRVHPTPFPREMQAREELARLELLLQQILKAHLQSAMRDSHEEREVICHLPLRVAVLGTSCSADIRRLLLKLHVVLLVLSSLDPIAFEAVRRASIHTKRAKWRLGRTGVRKWGEAL
ncbi:hypothetical protein EV401DRAFT_2197196 [Pisolithus croceorrhizus]|nr:hypothetical protein EV401DRAFT_2197196 [Pisolithus croceorrhizus]